MSRPLADELGEIPTFAALTDDQNVVIAATRRAWLGRPIADVLPRH